MLVPNDNQYKKTEIIFSTICLYSSYPFLKLILLKSMKRTIFNFWCENILPKYLPPLCSLFHRNLEDCISMNVLSVDVLSEPGILSKVYDQ